MKDFSTIRQIKPHFIVMVLALCLNAVVHAQSIDPELASSLQNTLDDIQLEMNIQGLSAAVFVPGQGLWTGVSGESHAGVPINPDMSFGIGSNTKTFTAVTVLKLVENNLVNLDDSLYEWLPSYNPHIDSTITIRQLLNHTSGIASTFDVPGFLDSLSLDRSRVFTTPEILSWLPEALYPAGMGQNYSNPNYHLAGLIIEQAANQDLEHVMRDSIFNVLGMERTFFPIYDNVEEPIAHPWHYGYDWNDTLRTSLLTSQWSAGAMYSTAGEMAQWYHELMNNPFLQPEEFNEMTTFVGPQERGFGLQQLELNGRIVWGHGGGTYGYMSIAVFDTLSKASIVVLINEAPSVPKMVAEELLLTLVDFSVDTEPMEISDNALTIYPNPASEKLWLKVDNLDLVGVRIYDVQGQLHLKTSSSEVSVENLKKGLYIIEIETRDECFVRTFVKH